MDSQAFHGTTTEYPSPASEPTLCCLKASSTVTVDWCCFGAMLATSAVNCCTLSLSLSRTLLDPKTLNDVLKAKEALCARQSP